MAGVRYDQVAAIENVLRLLPETKAIAIIIGNSPGERFWAGEHQRVLGPLLKNKVELIFYGEQPLNEILKGVASLPPHTAIFFQQLAVDGAGAVYGDKEPLKRIYEVANAPIFSFDQSYFNGEIVGGPMFSPAEGAQPMAAVAIRMLGGEKTSRHRSRSVSQPRNMIGDNFSDGTSARAACHRGAKSCFGNQRCGNGIRGRSHPSSLFF